ncbi:MAG: SH3 domain-containing protein [Opitutus sp.]
MKTKFSLSGASVVRVLLGTLALSSTALAAPLTGSTAAHTKADENSPVITVLSAGTVPTVATGAAASAPAGWIAVELPGPFEGFVANKDVLKSLDVRRGAEIHVAPKPDSPVLTTMDAADKAEITGLMGKWTQIRLEKKLVGFVHLTRPTSVPAPAATQKPAVSAPMSPAPVAATAYGVTTAGRPAPQVALQDNSGASLPRLLAGKFVSTRSAFKPRRAYDWALNDDAGKRYAFLDISKLLLTEQIESYVDHAVVVFGSAKPIAGTKEFVIEVESLQLK